MKSASRGEADDPSVGSTPALRFRRQGPANVEAPSRLKEWTRERFALPQETVIVVSESRCRIPGGPPIQTLIVFWAGDGTRYRIAVFKPVAEVVRDDLPVSWLLPSLVDDGLAGCDCC